MPRPSLFGLLLIPLVVIQVATLASAAELYRWIEEDGSITFSHEKPAPGTDYQSIDTEKVGSTKAVNRISRPAPPTRPASDGMPPAQFADAQKQQRCDALRKRVFSLERRLKSKLTAEEMDNTVVYMARYQQSYDRHCRG